MDGYGLYAQDGIHMWMFNLSGALTIPSTKYVALAKSSFTNSGLNFLEIEAPGVKNYSRATVQDNITWNTVVSRPSDEVSETFNILDIEFGPSDGAWGSAGTEPVTGFCVVDHISNGITPSSSPRANIFFGGNLDVSKIIEDDTKAIFASDNLKLQTKNTVI